MITRNILITPNQQSNKIVFKYFISKGRATGRQRQKHNYRKQKYREVKRETEAETGERESERDVESVRETRESVCERGVKGWRKLLNIFF